MSWLCVWPIFISDIDAGELDFLTDDEEHERQEDDDGVADGARAHDAAQGEPEPLDDVTAHDRASSAPWYRYQTYNNQRTFG